MPRDGTDHASLDQAICIVEASSSDLSFIETAAAYIRLWRQFDDTLDAITEDERAEADAKQKAIGAEMGLLEDRLVSLAATTPAELAARAIAMGTYDPDNALSYDEGGMNDLLKAQLRDGAALADTLISPKADARLLLLPSQHDAAFDHLNALQDAEDEVVSAAYDAMVAIEDQIEALSASTCEGVMAKVKVLSRIYVIAEAAGYAESLFPQASKPGTDSPSADQRLVVGIIRDLVAMVGAPA